MALLFSIYGIKQDGQSSIDYIFLHWDGEPDDAQLTILVSYSQVQG